MAGGLFGIGVSGLQAFQSALNTTSHNIANVNTSGYSRQQTLFEQRLPNIGPGGWIGSGVDAASTRRIYNEFVVGQVQSSTSAFESSNTYYNLAVQVDNLLADEQVGLSPGLENFFNAVQEVSNDPTSTAARQILLTEGESLSDRFAYLYDRMESIRADANGQITSYVKEINSLAQSLADINQDIVTAKGRVAGQTPNDLLDQRDAMIGQLSEMVSVRTVEQDDGSLSVFIGNGQSLVIGNRASQLSSQSQGLDPFQPDISIVNNGVSVPITDYITGGKLGGVLEFRGQVLDEAQNALGRVALGLTTDFNEQHRLGMDLNGTINQAFFSVPSPEVFPSPTNTVGGITVTIDDTNQLTAEDYVMRYDGAAWEIRTVSDNQIVTPTGTGTAADPFVFDGLTVEVTGAAPVQGDEFLIRPTRVASRDVGTLLDDPRTIAAAGPVISNAASTNGGTGDITLPNVVDITDPNLLEPVTITFTSPTTFDVVGVGTGNPTGVVYDPADPADVISFNGWELELSGAPVLGDVFTVSSNVGGVGDNRNAIALADLQQQANLSGSTASYAESYNELVGDVGTNTRKAEITSSAQEKLLSDAISTRESISGVNLDEEAANLLRYQQAYQAAAQVISTADTLFQTLLGAVRR
jgi:flagellar hook-associated protein 1 FlgK